MVASVCWWQSLHCTHLSHIQSALKLISSQILSLIVFCFKAGRAGYVSHSFFACKLNSVLHGMFDQIVWSRLSCLVVGLVWFCMLLWPSITWKESVRYGTHEIYCIVLPVAAIVSTNTSVFCSQTSARKIAQRQTSFFSDKRRVTLLSHFKSVLLWGDYEAPSKAPTLIVSRDWPIGERIGVTRRIAY